MEYNIGHNEVDEILVKYLTGSANSEERKIAVEWINQSEEHKLYFDQLNDIYQASKLTQKESSYNTEFSWERVKAKYYKRKFLKYIDVQKSERTFSLKHIAKYAAIIVISLGIGSVFTQIFKSETTFSKISWNVVEAPKGSKTSIVLADGTQVWLNAGSKLKYPGAFDNNLRQVVLEGEAFFEVAKDKKRRFVVKTQYIDVTALGTKFNVKAYEDEGYVQTTLVEGSIVVNSTENSGEKIENIYMKPNQMLTLIKDSSTTVRSIIPSRVSRNEISMISNNLILVNRIDPLVFTSWKDSKWIIKGESLSSLAKKLERKYNINIHFEDESIKKYKFSGTLKDESLEQVLNILKIAAPIEFTIDSNKVEMKLNKGNQKQFDKHIINTDTI